MSIVDEETLAALEARTMAAERRITALEMMTGGPNSTKYIQTLCSIREALVTAKEEHDVVEGERRRLVGQNEKLRYQIEHLKRAVREGDEKLAKLSGHQSAATS